VNDAELHKIVHDLRSPLTVIQGFAKMLERGEGRLSEEDRQEFVGRILEASGQMNEMIDGILKRPG